MHVGLATTRTANRAARSKTGLWSAALATSMGRASRLIAHGDHWPAELLPYPLVACELTLDATVVEVRGRRIGDRFFGLIAGPCTVETREQTLETARAVALMGKTVG